MNHREMETLHNLMMGMGKGKVAPYENHTGIILCGHVRAVVAIQDAYSIYLPFYELSFDICENCFRKIEGLYTQGTDREYDNLLHTRYQNLNFGHSDHLWLGNLAHLQIELERIRELQ